MAKKPTKTSSALIEDQDEKPFVSPPIRIVSAIEGFWRGGIQHTRAAVDHDEGAFTQTQLEQIVNEPTLTVMRVPTTLGLDLGNAPTEKPEPQPEAPPTGDGTQSA